jgi:hypothetical protein
MAASAYSTAQGKFEIVAWLDDDDPKAKEYPDLPFVRYLHGPREIQSNLWNRCWEQANGDIAMLCGDDVQFRTKGWAVRVNDAFDAYPDRLIMAYSRTGEPYVEATLPFVSREWISVVGTFTPPYFRSWFADRWIWEVAESLGRDVFLRNVLIQHRRPRLKSPNLDQTYLDGERFRREDDPESLYLSPRMLRERQEQAMRLCEAIEAAKAKPKKARRTRERVAV